MTERGAVSSQCPSCGSSERRPYAPECGHALRECLTCGLVAMEHLPTAEEVARLYRDAYQGATAGYFAKAEKKLRRSRRRARTLFRAMGARPGLTLLDVGSSGGFMVEAARREGFTATGVEIDPVSVDYARRTYPSNDYFLGTIEAFAAVWSGASFDAAYCSEVIEHVTDVNGFVAALARCLAPGAILFLTTPDIGHWRRPKMLKDWDAFAPPSHCLYFTYRALAQLLAKHGLPVERRLFNWKPGIKVLARRR
ncbi:MAG: methyltransferase domain-containing protein [Alphaproteobacteria bacterium]|nr:methyltransferase domain-containing protein [Alphaproteobacteria bacterium]